MNTHLYLRGSTFEGNRRTFIVIQNANEHRASAILPITKEYPIRAAKQLAAHRLGTARLLFRDLDEILQHTPILKAQLPYEIRKEEVLTNPQDPDSIITDVRYHFDHPHIGQATFTSGEYLLVVNGPPPLCLTTDKALPEDAYRKLVQLSAFQLFNFEAILEQYCVGVNDTKKGLKRRLSA